MPGWLREMRGRHWGEVRRVKGEKRGDNGGEGEQLHS